MIPYWFPISKQKCGNMLVLRNEKYPFLRRFFSDIPRSIPLFFQQNQGNFGSEKSSFFIYKTRKLVKFGSISMMMAPSFSTHSSFCLPPSLAGVIKWCNKEEYMWLVHLWPRVYDLPEGILRHKMAAWIVSFIQNPWKLSMTIIYPLASGHIIAVSRCILGDFFLLWSIFGKFSGWAIQNIVGTVPWYNKDICKLEVSSYIQGLYDFDCIITSRLWNLMCRLMLMYSDSFLCPILLFTEQYSYNYRYLIGECYLPFFLLPSEII